MQRRAFLAAALAAAFGGPLSGAAQPSGKLHRLGLLAPGPSPFVIDPFLDAMRERGLIEGRHFVLEARYTGADQERAAALAAELNDAKVDLILTSNTANAQAARRATNVVPIVMIFSGYPVEVGLAASLGRPGGNVTGNSIYAGSGLFAKYVELLKELVPGLKRLAVLWDYAPPGFARVEVDLAVGEMKRAAEKLDVMPRVFEIRTRAELDAALSLLARERTDALFLTHGPLHRQQATANHILDFAARRRLPTMTDFAGTIFGAGCLMTYSANPTELGRRAAGFVDRILKGASPADLPIEQPTTFNLALNLKTAKSLGLTIPPSLLLRADQVIE